MADMPKIEDPVDTGWRKGYDAIKGTGYLTGNTNGFT